MDDLNEKLERLLSSPDSMAKITSMLQSLGAGEAAPAPDPEPEAPAALPAAGDAMAALGGLMPLLGGGENDDTRLLKALRPYLHGPRQGRLDEAMQLLRLLRLLPLLQAGGLPGGEGA